MNPYACSRMIYDNKTLIINHENIGSLSFYSSYMPVRNIHNSVIAYLNLPYFAKQNENDNRISTFLTTFINTYIILVALSIIVVLLISNYITLPLKLIRDKISRVGLGRLNEKILWKHNDELGMLVHEYNSMIDKLAESADLLAKSERESAWREMAKQVAHEIKNPLTPMKLNIQHLLKISSNEHTTYNEQLNKVCKSLIEQIDILSDIASEFSDFAKMPSSKNQKVNLIQLINNSIELFRNYKDIHINFNEQLTTNIGQRFLVFADPNQLLRVFGNLIRNSIQAIEGKPDGRIDISVSSSDKFCLITISDNGSGIPLQDIHKIFSPNFTTKSGGSGLGLSISKSIIEAAGGSISFKSNPGSGTSFFISLPVFIES
jgi:nitrogen fixation/metabolism regulation signal transduction histidine kinase